MIRAAPARREVFLTTRVSGRSVSLLLKRSPTGRAVAGAVVAGTPSEPLSGACARAVGRVASAAGHAPGGRVVAMLDTRLAPDLRGLGLGAWLYAEVVRLAWRYLGAVVVAMDCVDGDTSDDAGRVWASRALAGRVAVDGHAAAWRASDDDTVPPQDPPGVRVVRVPGDSPPAVLPQLANPPRDQEAAARAIFETERARFARFYPYLAEAVFDVVDQPCNNDTGVCAPRDVAWCAWARRGRTRVGPWRVYLLRRALGLPRANLVAILRHELGHLADERVDEPGAEKRADRIASRVGGQPIRYDDRDLQTIGPGRATRPAHLHQ